MNYDVAARLVEVVSGEPFADHLRRAVFDPLGMRRSSADDRVVPPADGYNSLFGAWVSRPELGTGPAVNGSGGIVTTAADLGQWLVAQNGFGPRLVSPAGLETMHTPGPVREYGMGWQPDGTGLLLHTGNLFTYNAIQAIDGEWGFAVLTNGAGLYDDTHDVLTGLVALTRGETPEPPGGRRQWLEVVLAAVGVLALGLGTLGVVRSRRWATRRRATPPVWTVLRLVPALVPVAVLVAYPDLVSFVSNGRTVTWAQLTYFAAPLSIVLVTAALAGLAVTVSRLVRLRSAG